MSPTARGGHTRRNLDGSLIYAVEALARGLLNGRAMLHPIHAATFAEILDAVPGFQLASFDPGDAREADPRGKPALVVVLVEARLLEALDGAADLHRPLARLRDDLRAEGFAPRMVVAVPESGLTSLRHLLRRLARRYPQLAGALLVGAFPDDDDHELLDGLPAHVHISRIDARRLAAAPAPDATPAPGAPDARRERRLLAAYLDRNHGFRKGTSPASGLRVIVGHSDQWLSVFAGARGARRPFQWIWDDQIYAPSLRSQDNRAALDHADTLLFAGDAVVVVARPRAVDLPLPLSPDVDHRSAGDVIVGDWTLRLAR